MFVFLHGTWRKVHETIPAASAILDHSGRWINLALLLIERSLPGAHVVDLRDLEPGGSGEGQLPPV